MTVSRRGLSDHGPHRRTMFSNDITEQFPLLDKTTGQVPGIDQNEIALCRTAYQQFLQFVLGVLQIPLGQFDLFQEHFPLHPFTERLSIIFGVEFLQTGLVNLDLRL